MNTIAIDGSAEKGKVRLQRELQKIYPTFM